MGIEVGHPSVITRIPESHWADSDVGLNGCPVVVVSPNVSDIAIIPPQKWFPFVNAGRPRRMIVLQPHRPERLRPDLIHPVGIASGRRSQEDMERIPVVFVDDRNRRRAGVDVQQFVGNRFRAQRLQVRSIRLNLVQAGV